MLKDFAELVRKATDNPGKMSVVAIAGAGDKSVVDSGLKAREAGIAEPLFVGDYMVIRRILDEEGADIPDAMIVDAGGENPAQVAVDQVRESRADVLMKGLVDSKSFLGPLVKRENGLRGEGMMSHVALFEIPGYHKLFMTSDGGMILYPDLDTKVQIVNNAVKALHALGWDEPKLAAVCHVEEENPKIQVTVDGAELQRMNERGEITGCRIVGPISYDCAMSREIAEHKGYDCPYSGDFDGFILPDIVAGNILGKCLTVTAGAKMAGVVMGAKVPVILASRGSDADEKFNSIAMAALITRELGK